MKTVLVPLKQWFRLIVRRVGNAVTGRFITHFEHDRHERARLNALKREGP